MSRLNELDNTKSAIADILKDQEMMEYNGAEIYLLDSDDYRLIYNMYLQAIEELKLTNPEKVKNPFQNVAKLFGDMNSPIIAYKLYIKQKYKNIKDKEKVRKKIDALYEIEKHKIAKNIKNTLLEYEDKSDEVFKEKLKEDERIQKEELTIKYNFLVANFNNLEVVISTFRNGLVYPTIKTVNSNQIDSIEHLRAEVPNIIHCHENIVLLNTKEELEKSREIYEKSKEKKEDFEEQREKSIEGNITRKNSTHLEFMKDAIHSFADIYYKVK